MDETEADRIKILALHGMSKDAWRRFSDEGYKHYYVVDCGYKYNMMDIQAAFGIHQLRRIQIHGERRQEIVAGAKFRRATTTLVESQRGKTSMRVSWTSPS